MNAPQSPIEGLALVREANHRFANHLAVIVSAVNRQLAGLEKSRSEFVTRTDVRAMLEDLASTIYGIADLNRLIARNPLTDEVDLEELLRLTTENTISSLALQNRMVLYSEFSGELRVPYDKARALLMIVTEIVMNAIKYAHPTGPSVTVTLSCRRAAEGGIALEIGDDGIGLPEGFDVQNGGGMGFKVIRMLAHSLDAKLDIDSSPLGLAIRMRIPAVLRAVERPAGTALS